MPLVDILEFRLPNGRQIPQQKQVDDETFAKWELLKAEKLELQFEFLRTGDASFTIADSEEEEDVGMELCFTPNQEGISATLKKLIMGFDIEAWKKRKAERAELAEAEAAEYMEEESDDDHAF